MLAVDTTGHERLKILSMLVKNGDSSDVGKQDLANAKREYEAGTVLLEQLKLITEKIGLESGMANSVVIHEDPVIGQISVFPSVSRNRLLGIAGGFIFPPFLTLPVMWLMGQRKHIA